MQSRLLGCLALACVSAASANGQSATVVARFTAVRVLVRGADGTGLAGASVTIAGTSTPSITAQDGRTTVIALAGERFLHVRAVGYQAFDSLLTVTDLPFTVTVSLQRSVVQLDSVHVVAVGENGKPARYAETSKLDEFYLRRATSTGGTFLSREDIERVDRSDIAALLRKAPGVQVSTRPGGALLAYFPRCPGGGASRKVFSVGRADPIGRDGMETEGTISLYINGTKVGQPLTTLGSMTTDEIEAMEVYTGVAQLPNSARGDGCAAIYVWTRYGTGSVTKKAP